MTDKNQSNKNTGEGRWKIIIPILMILLGAVTFAAARHADKAISTPPLTMTDDGKFSNLMLGMPIEDFESLGFSYGDSVDLHFSSGKTAEDLPYCSGYYTKNGSPLVVGYPGHESISLSGNNYPAAEVLGIDPESDKVVITLRKKGGYSDMEKTFSAIYTDARSDYASDEEFANFREMTGGKLKEKMFYRSASPYDNIHNRATYVNRLCEKNNIQCILDLADSEEDMAAYAKKAEAAGNTDTYWYRLYKEGKIIPLSLSTSYMSETFRKNLVNGLKEMTKHKGPYLIHCTEGKDRTGFACLLLSALSGADVKELVNDYMETYKNYYGITERNAKTAYDAFVGLRFSDMVDLLRSYTGRKENDLAMEAREYLRAGGMSEEEIGKLEEILKK